MELEIGYIVEYSKKPGFFEPYSDRKKAFVTNSQLANLLQNGTLYAIWSATWVNYTEYRVNVGELPRLTQ